MKFSLFRRPKITAQNISIEERVMYIKSLNKYFENHLNGQPLFLPEYEISREILNIIESIDSINENKLLEIVSIYNRITLNDHYNGTGWFDFQIQLRGFFRHYNYSADVEIDTGVMRIEKK